MPVQTLRFTLLKLDILNFRSSLTYLSCVPCSEHDAPSVGFPLGNSSKAPRLEKRSVRPYKRHAQNMSHNNFMNRNILCDRRQTYLYLKNSIFINNLVSELIVQLKALFKSVQCCQSKSKRWIAIIDFFKAITKILIHQTKPGKICPSYQIKRYDGQILSKNHRNIRMVN